MGPSLLTKTPDNKRLWDGNNPFHQPAATTDYYGSGDVDNDGTLTAQDVYLAQAMINGTQSHNHRADVNGNGTVDAGDLSLINDALSGGILPAWWNRLTGKTDRNVLDLTIFNN